MAAARLEVHADDAQVRVRGRVNGVDDLGQQELLLTLLLLQVQGVGEGGGGGAGGISSSRLRLHCGRRGRSAGG